jgi:hypothetical protein
MIYLREYIESQIKTYSIRLSINFYLISIKMLINIGIGIMLGLEHLIKEIRKDGTWKINLPKIVLVGLPSLYFSFSYFLVYSNNLQFKQNIITYPLTKLMIYGTGFVSLFQLILGYVVITSFYKFIKKI